MWDILVSCPNMLEVIDDYRPRMQALGLTVHTMTVTQQLSEEDLLEVIHDFDGVIAGDDEFSGKVLQAGAMGRLKAISKWGVGVDNIDLERAERLGIIVTNTPGLLGNEVADVAIGYLILLARQLHRVDAAVRSGDWHKPTGQSLQGKTLGVVGAGSVGQALIPRALSLQMRVLVNDVSDVARAKAGVQGAELKKLDEMLASADYVALCCPLRADTHHLMNSRRLSLMASGACLINVSRGPLVDEPALINALEQGHLGGAALDVFEVEPLDFSNPLRTFPQVILGSHNASNTSEATHRIAEVAIDNLTNALSTAEQER
jgi:D-3-phosphoglycerate dehydrogenase